MKARYFVRVRLPTHWSCFAIVGPGKGSQAVANNVRQILLDQPGWPYEVRVFPTHAIPPWRGSRRRRIERAELQSEVEWDQDVVAAILAKARRGRRRDMIGLTPTPRQPKDAP